MSFTVALYGATGTVGSAFLAHLLASRLLKAGDRVVLVSRGTDASRAKLTTMRVDLLDAFDDDELDIDVVDSLEDVRADIFIMTAGAHISARLQTRRDLADSNAPIFTDTARRLSDASPNATVIVVANPVELGVAIFCNYFDRRRVIGMGAQQDSLRFARVIASRLGIRRSRVRASVYGEHGEAMVPAWSSVYVINADACLLQALAQLRLTFEEDEPFAVRNMMADVRRLLANRQFDSAYELVRTVSPQAAIQIEPAITNTGLGSTPHATANATMAFVTAFVMGDERKLHGQVVLHGEFSGKDGVTGAPLQLSSGGWCIAAHEPLTPREQHYLDRAIKAADYVVDLAPLSRLRLKGISPPVYPHIANSPPNGDRCR